MSKSRTAAMHVEATPRRCDADSGQDERDGRLLDRRCESLVRRSGTDAERPICGHCQIDQRDRKPPEVSCRR